MDKTIAYEGMFLLDAGNPDFQSASDPIRTILTRYGAEILALKPWDERRLAYEILGRKRALYVLTYFKVDPLKVHEIEHDCSLDERILRSLILRVDHLTQERVDAETPATSHKPLGEVTLGAGEEAEKPRGAMAPEAMAEETPEA